MKDTSTITKIIIIGIITGIGIGITSGVSYFIFKQDITIDDDESVSKMSVQDLLPYDYEDICGFPVTDEMRLNAIYDGSTNFTNDGMSYLTLRGGSFTHVELSQYYETEYPSLHYWFTLRNGQQVYFKIGACEVEGSNITLGKPGPDYMKIKPGMYDNEYHHIQGPGFPLINTVTMQPVLDIENCQGIAEYYTTLQSHTMFTRENVTFDPLWKDQVFPLMDYCNDIGNYEIEILYEKIKWSFKIK